MEKVYDTIVVGGGPAGYTAALYACRLGLETLVIEKMSAGGQIALTSKVDNYPGFEEGIDGYTLGEKMRLTAERFGAVTKRAEVIGLDLKDKIKSVSTSAETFLTKTVILAMGAYPRELGVDKERSLVGKGVSYCAHCDGMFFKDKTVVVVGGGDTAAADATVLSRIAKKVYVVHRRDTLRASKIYHQPLLKADNVEFCWNSSVTELFENGRLNGVKVLNLVTGKEDFIEAEGLFVSIGRIPATELVKGQIELDDGGYIVSREDTKTNIPGVFAAGDLRTKDLRQVITAASDGAVAAHFAEEYINAL